jgi:hypothetical protein
MSRAAAIIVERRPVRRRRNDESSDPLPCNANRLAAIGNRHHGTIVNGSR